MSNENDQLLTILANREVLFVAGNFYSRRFLLSVFQHFATSRVIPKIPAPICSKTLAPQTWRDPGELKWRFVKSDSRARLIPRQTFTHRDCLDFKRGIRRLVCGATRKLERISTCVILHALEGHRSRGHRRFGAKPLRDLGAFYRRSWKFLLLKKKEKKWCTQLTKSVLKHWLV